MKLTPEKRRRLTLWIIGVATAIILVFLGIQNVDVVAGAVSWCFGLVSSLVVGLAIALIVNVPMRFFESIFWKCSEKPILKRLRRPAAYLVSVIVILGILAGIFGLIIPQLVEAVTVIVTTAVDFVNELNAMEDAEIAELPLGQLLIQIDWNKLLDSLQNWLKNQSGTIVNTAFGTITSVVGGVFDLFVSFAFSIYILFSKEKLKGQATRLVRVWIPKRFSEWFIHAFSVLNTNLRNFIFGQSIEAVIIGVLCMLGMLIFRIPYAPTVGALVGVTALIPVVGSFIGAIVGALLIVTVSPLKALGFIIFLIVLQQVEGNVIYPKVMGSKVNLPGLWILAAVTVGGGIAGVIGMLISVPVASTLYVLLREATREREKKIAKAESLEAASESKDEQFSLNNEAEEQPQHTYPKKKSTSYRSLRKKVKRYYRRRYR